MPMGCCFCVYLAIPLLLLLIFKYIWIITKNDVALLLDILSQLCFLYIATKIFYYSEVYLVYIKP